ncbi:PucR family transcriptional regulator [Haloechinothrix halophila]|uniref:PucR family transcriptional regulator n=1 Tax=Haloechinothrix halophila TaxID=1069073 RepID=UPI0003FB2BFD|nr:PucR family transcriptional regulator [Haloechinothrix halophila]
MTSVHRQSTHVPGERAGGTAQEILSTIPPSQIAVIVRPVAGRMITEIVKEIRAGVPAYGAPRDDELTQVLVSSVERAVRRLIDGKDKPRTDGRTNEDWFRRIGRMEFYAGRSMDSMQTAVRIGTRVAWRHLWRAGAAAGVPSSTFNTLADALFHYSDELSSAAIAGHTEAQARANGTAERIRQRLVRMILADPPISPQAITDLAEDAGWTVPDAVALVAVEQRPGQRALHASSFGPDVLVDPDRTEPCLVLAEPDRHLGDLRRKLRGGLAAVGPRVSLSQAVKSLECAHKALDLGRRGVLPSSGVIDCAEHLPTLAMYADEFILAQLTERAFRPFAGLTSRQRTRLSETLRAWLDAGGSVSDVAARLDVHPQTVRYRMNQITNLLGGSLDNPDERFLLDMALRAVQVRGVDIRP